MCLKAVVRFIRAAGIQLGKVVAVGGYILVAACESTPLPPVTYDEGAPTIRSDYHSMTTPTGSYRNRGPHRGIDIGSGGDIVIAMADGYVRRSDFEEYLGNRVTLDHGKDVDGKYTLTLYSLLKKRLVEVCKVNVTSDDIENCPLVKRGTPIGVVGLTGRLSGSAPHLHFGVYKNTTRAHMGWVINNPHNFWLNGPFNVTCFDPNFDYSSLPQAGLKLTLPLYCQ